MSVDDGQIVHTLARNQHVRPAYSLTHPEQYISPLAYVERNAKRYCCCCCCCCCYYYYYYYYYIRLTAFFQDNLGKPAPER